MKARVPRYIYFIKPVGKAGPIKIGCSQFPANRLVALSVWSPFPLEIVAVAPGNIATEQSLHRRFADHRAHREWFEPAPELVELIDALKHGARLADLHSAPPLKASAA